MFVEVPVREVSSCPIGIEIVWHIDLPRYLLWRIHPSETVWNHGVTVPVVETPSARPGFRAGVLLDSTSADLCFLVDPAVHY